jgi:predicted metal-dependent hydrolase
VRTWVFRRIYRTRRRRRGSSIGRISRALFVKNSKVEYKEHKERARTLINQKITDFNAFYHFNIGRISIRNQRSRWGSCSKRGNLNFNYRVVLLPDALLNYVIVHEMCHIGEFNHSKNFWNLVAQTIPDHVELRKQLHKIKF